MGRTWILHTGTKGTGAQMVPLEKLTERPSGAEPVFVPQGSRQPQAPEISKDKEPLRFKIVDVMTRQAVVDSASAREAVNVLKRVRSIVDVNIYSWDREHDRWRLLTLADQRAMWELSRR